MSKRKGLFAFVLGVALALGTSASAESERKIRVACIGDSITWGYAMTNRVAECYPAQLQRLLGPKYEVRNFGDPGSCVYSQPRRLPTGWIPHAWRTGGNGSAAYAFEPDIVVSNLGINDSGSYLDEFVRDGNGRPKAEQGLFRREYVDLLQAFGKNGRKPRIILWSRLGPLGKRHGLKGTPGPFVMETDLQAVARTVGAETLDMYTPLLSYAETSHFAADGIHPEGGAQRVIAEVTARCILGKAEPCPMDENLSVLISDIHLQTVPTNAYAFTAREFPKRVDEILAMRPRPRRVICFGDLVFDHGEPASYAFLRKEVDRLERAGVKVVLGMGNHDRRKAFLAEFPEAGKNQPVPGRIVHKVDLGHCDLILLDTLNGAERAVGGEIGPEQEAWLRREVAAAKRPLILGAHHGVGELTVGGRPLFEFMRGSDKIVGWINGHGHWWCKENLCWGPGPNEDVIRALMLPTGGAWGEIGVTTLRTYPDRAEATLRMIDMVWHDALRPGEKRPKVYDAIVADQDGERIVFPYERAMLRGRSKDTPVDARMAPWQGAPAIMVNGQPYPPMTFTLSSRKAMSAERQKAYLQKIGAAGLKIHYVGCATRWLRSGDPAKGIPDGIEAARTAIRKLIDAIPDAYVMLRLNVSPPADWVNAHPEEQMKFSDGSHRKVICTSVGMEPIDGMHSLCSKAWMEREDEAIAEFFRELAKTPEFGHVIGTFLCAAGTGEWYYPQELVVDGGKAWGDFSEPFRAYYEGYLRRKYGTVEELRRVWKRPDATFEKPIIPTAREREYATEADAKIVEALRNWENAGRVVGGMKLNMDAREKESVGVFLNANGHAHVADFFTAWHESTAATIVHFAKTLKRLRPNLLVGAFYGSYGCQSFFDGSTASGTRTILDSGVVDFLAAPGVYNNREPGGVVAQREMQDSFRLRNMIYICEDDSRTHLCEPWMQRDAMALYGVKDSIDTLKRDFARDICEDIHGWWFDMGPGWYDDPQILALFTRQQEIAREAYWRDRTKRNDIALVYDTESLHYASQAASQLVVDFWRTTDLARIGAPVDYYFHNDLTNPKMPDYRLYVMLHQYYLTDAEREAVYAKARRNGATILWMYAPGFVNPRAEKVMDVANVEKTVGMKLGFIDKTFFPHFTVDPKSHPALAGASATRRYGVIDRDLHSNIWIGPLLTAPYLNPGFTIDDPKATVLGRYCCNGKPALAMVERDGVKSVYCATQVMRSDLLASIAEYAGCHIYAKDDDILFANESYVAVHASSDGRKTIRFKRPCSPYEVYERRAYGHDVDRLEVDMRLGETKMWQIRQ